MNNKNYIHAHIALFVFLFLGITGCISESYSIISEDESIPDISVDSIPTRNNPEIDYPADVKIDTVKITVDFDTEYRDCNH